MIIDVVHSIFMIDFSNYLCTFIAQYPPPAVQAPGRRLGGAKCNGRD